MSTLLQWVDDGGDTIVLDIDVAKTLTYERAAEVTEHPVENGSPASDHIKTINGSFSLEGVISDSPLRVPVAFTRGLARATGNAEVTVGGETVRVSLQRWSGPLDRKRACNDVLVDLVTKRYVVTLTTSLEVVDDLAVTRFKVTEDENSGNALMLALDFKRLRLVGTARAAVPAVRRMQVRANRGAQAPADDRSSLARGQDGGAPPTPMQRAAARERAIRAGRPVP